MPDLVLRKNWISPGIAEVIEKLLQGTHCDPVSGEDMGREVEVVNDHLSCYLAPLTQVFNDLGRHIEVQSPFVGAEFDVHNSVAVTGSRRLQLVTPVLHCV